jgi:transcriptional regulator with XRE-family HTH domain
LPREKTMKRSKPRFEKQTPSGTAISLRLGHGAIAEIARRTGVNRSTVSRVARGEKTSERVYLAIIRYLLQNDGRSEKREPAGLACGPREMGVR